ncbi:trichohyalin isoform X2 [Agrilus planipennis]|uniref:Trichohyalin isoform X2 n=1 Tax=Agrilus planipennis TaxID=224129 RepID=A0A1W4WEM3_AGRPL|nr:trichohyalin isoform X2 [Agrilus planipennis]
MTNAGQSVACEEVFDEISQPSVDEIKDYASKIGIDPDSEPQLLPLAVEGLMKPLPPGWKPFYDETRKCYYYFNKETNKTQWEHPLDEVYRDLVVKVRAESQSLSMGEPTEDATYTREDLPSYEEPPPPLQLSIHKKNIKLSPLRSKPKLGEIGARFSDAGIKILPKHDTKLFRQKSEERPARKIGLTLFDSFDEKPLLMKKELEKAELTLTGGGTMFLKSNTKKPETTPSPLGDKIINQFNNEINNDKKIFKDFEDDKRISKPSNLENDSFLNLDGETFEKNPKMKVILTPKVIHVEKNDTTKVASSNNKVRKSELNDATKINNKANLKVIKPDPLDFLKPELTAKNEPPIISPLSPESEEDKEKAESSSSTEGHLHLDENLEMRIVEDAAKAERIFKEESYKKKEEIKRLIDLDREAEIKKYREELLQSQKSEMEKILVEEKRKYEDRIRNELETLRKEMEHRSNGTLKEEKTKLETKLEQQKRQLQEHFKNEEQKLEQSYLEKFEKSKQHFEEDYKLKLIDLEKELERKLEETKDNLLASQSAILDQIRQKHSNQVDKLQKECQTKKEEEQRNTNFSSKETTKDSDDEKYEKIIYEKRLLEEKYRCLKEKYLKLKTDVKLSIEKRNKRREQSLTTTTGSETEKSPSVRNRKNSPKHLRLTAHDIDKKSKFDHKTRHILIQDLDTSTSDKSLKSDKHCIKSDQKDYDSSDVEVQPGRSRRKLFSRLKSSSLSRVNGNSKSKDSRSCSPVENLRKQLQKLEDLEDQFPQNSQGDTYHLRYPFSDGQKFEGSSELEFFRHRIHLERDSIRRAKESLRKQKTQFKQKQNEMKLKHGANARQTLQQLCQEEKELTDMEVSLHRTRSLLGEKVIRLRHLEQSLHRASVPSSNNQQKLDDATLSDLSSHSASSGISSTEFVAGESPSQAKNSQFKESSEIIQSLENLNSEIREIWEVLNKQQHISSIATVMTPLPLVYPDLGWPILSGTAGPVPPSIPTLADRLQNYRQHIALANAQSTMVTHDTQGATTTLVEKTRNLRQWLRQNSLDPSLEAGSHQTTL